MTREEHHAHLRELGLGWLVDEVERRPGPHVASARRATYKGFNGTWTGVRLVVRLTLGTWRHKALAEVSDAELATLGNLLDKRRTVARMLDELTADVAASVANLAARHALRGRKGIL